MDAGPRDPGHDPLTVTGLGHALVGAGAPPCDPTPWLKVRKSRKFMGVQDDLAVAAAGAALASAGLAGRPLGDRTGLYLAVGYIPFEKADIDLLLKGSLDAAGRFDARLFVEGGYREVNPLLTFRCLSNMPAFHVSVNFDIQGPYFVTYPGAGQFYCALDVACAALADGTIDIALVGGVAHQRNYLVEHHFARVRPPVAAERLIDGAGFVVLETPVHAGGRGAAVRGRLLGHELGYRAHHPFEEALTPRERWEETPARVGGTPPVEVGPASLPAALSRCAGRAVLCSHVLESRDGIRGASRWEVR